MSAPGPATADIPPPVDDTQVDPALLDIDPALYLYRQTGEIKTELSEVRGLAVGPDRHVYVAGGRVIRRSGRRTGSCARREQRIAA